MQRPFPYNLYKNHAFKPVMNFPKPLQPVLLNENSYPDSVKSMNWQVGGYLENRKGMYSSELYKATRYIHLGIDVWAPAGEPVFAISDGVLYGVKDNNNHLDYGPTVILAHEIEEITFYMLYGHLSRDSLKDLRPGQQFKAGELVARLGDFEENGGWVPHLHVQLGLSEPIGVDMPGVCAPDEIEYHRNMHPDPRFVLGPLY
jgi:murein DD-endopeptidase MepM/ murein hydrolase activator NlpD